MGVLCPERDVGEIFHAEESRANSFAFENNIFVNPFFDDEMENVIEFSSIIGTAQYFDVHAFIWLEHSMLLNGLKNADLVFGKGVEISLDFRLVGNDNFL